MEVESLNHFKSVTAHHFFIAPADEDYLAARWMLANGFPSFFWQACQALEKYFKAGIVLNGLSAKGLGHSLSKCHARHVGAMGSFAVLAFSRPAGLHESYWDDETVAKYLHRIESCGQPDGRYGLVGWWRNQDDLFKLDQLCWHLRRLAIGLDWIVGEDFPPSESMTDFQGKTYREALQEYPQSTPRGAFDGLDTALINFGTKRGEILARWNFHFRDPGDEMEPNIPSRLVPEIGPARNSLWHLYLKVLRRRDPNGAPTMLPRNLMKGLEWMMCNIELPKDIRQDMEAQLRDRQDY